MTLFERSDPSFAIPSLADGRAGRIAQRLCACIAGPRFTLPAALGLGLVCAALPIGLRWGLSGWLRSDAPFTFFFPGLLVAALAGGRPAGSVVLVLALSATPAVFLRGGSLSSDAPVLVAFGAAASATVAIGLFLRATIRALARSGEANAFLARELRHRVKNNIAVIDGLAAQTARSATDLPEFLEAFRARLFALASTQDLLALADQGTVRVDEVVQAVLSPFGGRGQIHFDGDGLAIAPEQVATLALCIHELATNATKYGALSAPDGLVDVRWRPLPGGSVAEFSWREHGAPARRPSGRTGFGARLLARGLDPSRGARSMFDAEGFSWRAEFPVLCSGHLPRS